MKLALESPVLHQFFTGRFVRAEPMPFEPERVIAYFDCSLPPEIIGHLGASADPLRVRLLWHPALVHQAGFQIGLLLLGASALSLVVGLRKSAQALRGRRPATAEIARFDTSHSIKVSRDTPLRSNRDSMRDDRLSAVEALLDANDPAQ